MYSTPVMTMEGPSCVESKRCDLKGKELLTYTEPGAKMATQLNAVVVASMMSGSGVPDYVMWPDKFNDHKYSLKRTKAPSWQDLTLKWAHDPCEAGGQNVNKGIFKYSDGSLTPLEGNYGKTTISQLIAKYPDFKSILVLCCMNQKQADETETAVMVANVVGCVAQTGVRGTAVGFKIATLCAREGGQVALEGIPLVGVVMGCVSSFTRASMSLSGTACGTMSYGMLSTQLGLCVVELGAGVASCWPGPGTVVSLSLNGAVTAADVAVLAIGNVAMGGDVGTLQSCTTWDDFVGTWEQRSPGWFSSSVQRRFRIEPGKVTVLYSSFRPASDLTVTGEQICDGQLIFNIFFFEASGTPKVATWTMSPGGGVVCQPSGNTYDLVRV